MKSRASITMLQLIQCWHCLRFSSHQISNRAIRLNKEQSSQGQHFLIAHLPKQEKPCSKPQPSCSMQTCHLLPAPGLLFLVKCPRSPPHRPLLLPLTKPNSNEWLVKLQQHLFLFFFFQVLIYIFSLPYTMGEKIK